MTKVFQSAFADWPKTKATGDGGIHVGGRYVQPSLESAGSFVVMAGMLIGFLSWGFSTSVFLGILGAVAGAMLTACVMYVLFARRLDITVYPDRITVASSFSKRNYSRMMPIEFRISQHQKATRRVYRDAIEVVMQYGEVRVPLAEMTQQHIERAQALVIRLQNLCEGMDVMSSMAGDTAGKARSDFGPVPDIR